MSDLTLQFLPGDEYFYAIASGAAHGRQWFTLGLEGVASQIMRSIAYPVLALSDALVKMTYAYVGRDPARALQQTHGRRVALSPLDGDREGAAGDWTHYHARLMAERVPRGPVAAPR